MKKILFLLYFIVSFLCAGRGWATPLLTDTIYTDLVFYPTYYTAVSNSDGTTTFSMTFNKTPNFYEANNFGLQLDRFEIYLDSTGSRVFGFGDEHPFIEECDKYLNANNIHDTSMIQFYDYELCPNPPCARVQDRIGSLIAEVPYTLTNRDMEFSIPLDSDNFRYRLLLYEVAPGNGGGLGETYVLGQSGNEYKTFVPEPATMLLLGSGLVGLAVIGRKMFKK